MNQYYIKIDGLQANETYTYQELVDMGLFELDANGIEVRNVTEVNFTPLRSYHFIERNVTNNSSFHVDKFDHKPSSYTGRNSAYVDEYGQIVRPNGSSSSASNTTNATSANNSSSNTSSSSANSNNSSSNNDGELFLRIVGSIAVVAIGLWILFAMADADVGDFWSLIPMGIGYYILKQIWGWDD